MKEAKRNFILEKAEIIFLKKGFEKTKLSDIAKAAKISVPTIYNFFSGKNDIFYNVVKSINRKLNVEITTIFYIERPFYEVLERLIDKFFYFIEERSDLLRINYLESRLFFELLKNNEKDEFRSILVIWEDKLSVLRKFFEDGKKNGFVRKDIHTNHLIIFFTAILEEIFFELIIKENTIVRIVKKEIKKDIIKFIKYGLVKKEEK